MLVVFPLIFVADTKIIYGYNFVAPLKQIFHGFLFNIRNYSPEVRNIQRHEALKV